MATSTSVNIITGEITVSEVLFYRSVDSLKLFINPSQDEIIENQCVEITSEEYDTLYRVINSLSSKIDELKLIKQNSVNNAYYNANAQVCYQYTQCEVNTWDSQKEEAIAYQANPSSDTPMIDAIIAESGEDKATFISGVIANVLEYKQYAGNLLGQKRAKESEILAATTEAELDAISVEFIIPTISLTDK